MSSDRTVHLAGVVAIARYEVRQRLRSSSTWIYIAICAVAGLLMILGEMGFFDHRIAGDRIANAPTNLALFAAVTGLLSLPMMAAVAGTMIHQDTAYRCEYLFSSTAITPATYLLGRYLAAVTVIAVMEAAIPLGMWFATLAPSPDPHVIGPNRLLGYVEIGLMLAVPNAVLFGAMFLALAALGRSMAWVHTSAVVIILCFIAAGLLTPNLDDRTLAAFLDPFGMIPLELTTSHWTLAERNTALLPWEGLFLANRVMWLLIAALIMAWCLARFQFRHHAVRSARSTRRPSENEASAATPHLPTPIQRVQGARALLLALRQAWPLFTGTVKRPTFLVMLGLGLVTLCLVAHTKSKIFGTAGYAVTSTMIGIIPDALSWFAMALILIISGELVWRERDAGFDQIVDALPVPDWLPLVAKLAALVVVQVLIVVVVSLASMAFQLVSGGVALEPLRYAQGLGGFWLAHLVLAAALALAIQGILGNRYIGWCVVALVPLCLNWLHQHGFAQPLYHYGVKVPPLSDLNGFSGFVLAPLWQGCYSAAWASCLLLVAHLCWQRGVERGPRALWSRIRQRYRPWSLAGVLAVVLTGTVISRETGVDVPLRTPHEDTLRKERYYSDGLKWLDRPQPRIIGVTAAIDLFPSRQHLHIRGSYELANATAQPIMDVVVQVPESATVEALSVLGEQRPAPGAEDAQVSVYHLAHPLLPGQRGHLAFSLDYQVHGLDRDSDLVANGTFLNSAACFPALGYRPRDEAERRLDHLPARSAAEDLAARQNTYISHDSDWLSLDLTVSTELGQTVLASGDLERRWDVGARSYARFTAKKALNYFDIVSARYDVKRVQAGAAVVEVYHHPTHAWNVERMAAAAAAALAYCTENFGPYPYRALRIAEFPAYRQFAQSTPALIPFSESIGFIARVDPANPKDIDYPYYITAHEVGHQWWGHQLIGGDVAGATMLSETFAQYTALMVMKRAYGETKVRNLLRYEADNYLTGRGAATSAESPLSEVTADQPYVHYGKGALVMYEVQDLLGEEALNRVLRTYLAAEHHRGPPYTHSGDFLARLRAAAPERLRARIDRLFTRVVVYDLATRTATCKKRADGAYDLTMTVSAFQLGAGSESLHFTPLDADQTVDIGALDADGGIIARTPRTFPSGHATVTIVVPRRPVTAGLDPLGTCITRLPQFRMIPVTER